MRYTNVCRQKNSFSFLPKKSSKTGICTAQRIYWRNTVSTKFRCRVCRTPLKAENEVKKSPIHCPACSTPIHVPGKSADKGGFITVADTKTAKLLESFE